MSIAVTHDDATPGLQALKAQLSPARIAAELGPRLTRLMQRNFRTLGTNKQGWPSTQFWAHAAQATNWQPTNSGLDIICGQIGVRQRLLGGTIKPVNAGALTIPADPAAYGKTAREFSNLHFSLVMNPQTGHIQPALVEAAASEVKFGKIKKDGTRKVTHTASTLGTHVMYWLCKSVTQQPNPAVLPPDEQWNAEFDKGMQNLLARI